MKIVALLTGRGNNTLPDKNIRDVLGQPVLYYIANAAKKAKGIDCYFVSSDNDKILDEADKLGYEKIIRPAELATPTSQHIDCILHSLGEMKKRGVTPDILVVLLANNLTVKSEWIQDCVQLLRDNSQASSVIPVYQDNDHHPLRAKSLGNDGYLTMYEKGIIGKVSTNRQELPKCYFPAHNFWVLRTNCITDENGQQPWSFMGKNILPYEIHKSIDIHEEIDLFIAKEWLQENYTD